MIIIGVDPALAATGVAVVEAEENGTIKLLLGEEIKTGAGEELPFRLKTIYSRLQGVVCNYRPEVMVLEKLYAHHRHPVTASLLGHVRGTVCLASAQSALKLYEYAPTRVGKALLGQGQTSPEQMSRMVHQLLQMPPGAIRSEHIVDAVALAVTYVYQKKWANLRLSLR